MRRFRKEFGLKKARILRERLIPVSQGLKIGINRQRPSSFRKFSFRKSSDYRPGVSEIRPTAPR